MQIQYTVFSAEDHDTPVQATLPGGGAVTASVPALTVQLLPAASEHGTVKLVFTGNDIAPAREKFVVGASITSTFA
jgi:hypothetical protein